MQGSTQETVEENTHYEHEKARSRGRYMTLFVVKCLLGILLLILGGVAVKNTQGQKNTFGPPYFLGAFLVGCAMILASPMDIFMFRNSKSSDPATLQKLSKYHCIEILLTNILIIGGFVGIFFVAIFGIPECDPSDFRSRCNYTDNLSTNRNLAIAILISLLVSEIIAIGSIVMHCHTCKGRGPYNMLKARKRRFTPYRNIYIDRGAGIVVMTTAPVEPRPVAGGFGANHNYDSYNADTQIMIDGNVIGKNSADFAGAVRHPPQNTTVNHPPMGYSQYPSAANQNRQYSHECQGNVSVESVHHLQEQNRLLREQIVLQQQQLRLMQQQQQQQQSESSSSLPPPPSYESCMQDPVQLKFLQQQNEELQNRYHSQQKQLTEKIPFSKDRHIAPSAPPI
ncbi:uncharacterized protein LOC123549000 [Mercenaria mercenaria]|uniref:uncharacterized protein LOC123549000 n=1 Tax=Mercenaria mercenaria TaxID=6596 RepID=UPI00234F0D9A|nr:uncharacterized protein LOC123549000 [Mercenaria mercenaria]